MRKTHRKLVSGKLTLSASISFSRRASLEARVLMIREDVKKKRQISFKAREELPRLTFVANEKLKPP